jgi:hypothetical protein
MEGGLGLERAHMVSYCVFSVSQADSQGMFTELSVLYAKYRPEKRKLSSSLSFRRS